MKKDIILQPITDKCGSKGCSINIVILPNGNVVSKPAEIKPIK